MSWAWSGWCWGVPAGHLPSQALVRRQCGLLCELAHLLTVFVASQWARTGVWQFWGRVVGGLRTDRVESWTGMKGKLRQPLSWPF